jgi:hypothetical protein
MKELPEIGCERNGPFWRLRTGPKSATVCSGLVQCNSEYMRKTEFFGTVGLPSDVDYEIGHQLVGHKSVGQPVI